MTMADILAQIADARPLIEDPAGRWGLASHRDGLNLMSPKIFVDRQKYIAKSRLLRHFEVAALSAPFPNHDAETTHAAL